MSQNFNEAPESEFSNIMETVLRLQEPAGPKKQNAVKIKVRSYTAVIECPHCGHENTGWLSDPRGGDSECDECESFFDIPESTEVVLI